MSTTETYLDNAATARPLPEVVDAVADAMRDGFGNASAQHARGQRTKELLEKSRATLAQALDVDPAEVFFTSGGTESNNLAVAGTCRAAYARTGVRGGIVAGALEHPSVTKSVRGLKREGWPVRYIPARNGQLRLDMLEGALDADTALLTCMRVNNELGYIFPTRDIVSARNELAPNALVHADGVQAFGKIDFRPHKLGIDLASISAHKIGGPQGIGALFVKQGSELFTTAFGGGQERGLRSGTEAVPLAVGFARAVETVFAQRERKEREIASLNRMLIDGIVSLCPDVQVNSHADGSPFIANFSIPGMDNTAALAFLSQRGVYVSKASACESLHPDVPAEDWRKKHPTVLLLSGVDEKLIESTLRISFSQESTEADVEALLAGLAAFFAST